MGQLGMPELLAIFVIALLVFGPRKLPELGKSLGKALREFKRATNEMKASWDDQMRDAGDEVRATARELKAVERDVQKDLASEKPSPQAQRTETIARGTIQPPEGKEDASTAGNLPKDAPEPPTEDRTQVGDTPS